METVSGELTDFCLVLAPDATAAEAGSDAVRRRFTFLDEGTRMELVSAIAERVRKLVEWGSGRAITVAISIEADAIHARVSDEDEAHERPETRFEISPRAD